MSDRRFSEVSTTRTAATVAADSYFVGDESSSPQKTFKILLSQLQLYLETNMELAKANVTDLVADLAGKSDTDHIHLIETNDQIGTTYTLQASDAQGLVRCTNANAITVTVPASVFSAGQQVAIEQGGAGVITLQAGSGMTLNALGGVLTTPGQYGARVLHFKSATAATYV